MRSSFKNSSLFRVKQNYEFETMLSLDLRTELAGLTVCLLVFLHYRRHTNILEVVFVSFRIQRTLFFLLIYSFLTSGFFFIVSPTLSLISAKHVRGVSTTISKKKKKKVRGEVILTLFVPPAAISGDLETAPLQMCWRRHEWQNHRWSVDSSSELESRATTRASVFTRPTTETLF